MRTVNKLVTLDQAATIATRFKSEGRTIVLTNGCFDLLHVGHIRYLEAAKKEGDVLIVALNSDESVRTLKGPSRPVMDQDERAEIISALSCVDYVLIFDESTVDGVIERLQPSVHAKGTDYTEDSVPERETLARIGGRVAIVGDPKDHSTKDFLKKIREI
jgi:rfaE bifunctional protein nucleotidyltransferase chain/domain